MAWEKLKYDFLKLDKKIYVKKKMKRVSKSFQNVQELIKKVQKGVLFWKLRTVIKHLKIWP